LICPFKSIIKLCLQKKSIRNPNLKKNLQKKKKKNKPNSSPRKSSSNQANLLNPGLNNSAMESLMENPIKLIGNMALEKLLINFSFLHGMLMASDLFLIRKISIIIFKNLNLISFA